MQPMIPLLEIPVPDTLCIELSACAAQTMQQTQHTQPQPAMQMVQHHGYTQLESPRDPILTPRQWHMQQASHPPEVGPPPAWEVENWEENPKENRRARSPSSSVYSDYPRVHQNARTDAQKDIPFNAVGGLPQPPEPINVDAPWEPPVDNMD